MASGSAIVPGKPGESLVVERLLSDDDSMRMPPPDSDKDLTAEQIRMLQQWIVQGATYTEHWAFRSPVRPAVPSVKNADWSRNAIDFFVLARLEALDLEPSPEVDSYTLVRRVYLDLIGLPPTPEEAAAFVSNSSPDAYEQLVDRLLASPHYGERWARRWLDPARYSDTNGYEKDRQRSIWPYRDWLIDALNQDMPFDQFLAGKMSPVPIIGVGFQHEWAFTDDTDGWEVQNQLEVAVRDGKLITNALSGENEVGPIEECDPQTLLSGMWNRCWENGTSHTVG